jgi:hypothetical protein
VSFGVGDWHGSQGWSSGSAHHLRRFRRRGRAVVGADTLGVLRRLRWPGGLLRAQR